LTEGVQGTRDIVLRRFVRNSFAALAASPPQEFAEPVDMHEHGVVALCRTVTLCVIAFAMEGLHRALDRVDLVKQG
jgi:hypothetical protein